jgi:hypothetical protein
MLELLLRRRKKWKGIRQDMRKYIQGCLVCQKVKLRTGPGSNKLKPLLIAGEPWEAMSLDLIGLLPESRTFNTIITMVDTRTKAIKLEAANVMISA